MAATLIGIDLVDFKARWSLLSNQISDTPKKQKILANVVEQIPPWEVGSHVRVQEISCLL
jgi:hypothetical protein